MINGRKKRAVEGMATVFFGKATAANAIRGSEIDQFRAKFGQLRCYGLGFCGCRQCALFKAREGPDTS